MTAFSIFLIILIITIALYDLMRMVINNRYIREYKYPIYHSTTLPTLVLAIFGFLYSLYGFLIHFTYREQALSSLLILMIVCINTSLHILQKSYVCDKGIWFIGYLYRWCEVKSYRWDKNMSHIIFNVTNKIYKNEIKIKFRIKAGLNNEIDSYVIDNLRLVMKLNLTDKRC
jgi:hypothetical protein